MQFLKSSHPWIARLLVIVSCWFLISAMPVGAADNFTNAALQGDWAQVYGKGVKATMNTGGLERDLFLGYASMHQKDWPKAWQYFSAVDKSPQKTALLPWAEKLCQTNPGSAMALVFKGDALIRQQRYQEAGAALDRAVQLNPQLALAYELRGLARFNAGANAQAKGDLDAALKVGPPSVNALYERALLDLNAKDYPRAETELTSLLAREPKFFLARNARGIAYVLQAKYDPAIKDFEQAFQENHDFVVAQKNKEYALRLRSDKLLAEDLNKMAQPRAKGPLGSTGRQIVLLDVPGVNYQGAPRQGNWGTLLNPDHLTIYIRHEGSPLSPKAWDPAAEKYAKVVTLPHDWNEKTAEKILGPILESGLKTGKSIHIISDLNVTFARHFIIGKKDEDVWGGKLADYVFMKTRDTNPETFRVFAGHSHGTLVPGEMKHSELIQYGILASPRGDLGLSLVTKNPKTPVDIIRGNWDAPSWRWKIDIEKLPQNTNARLIELKRDSGSLRDWGKVHSSLQDLDIVGKLDLKSAGGISTFDGKLRQPITYRMNSLLAEDPKTISQSLAKGPLGTGVGISPPTWNVITSFPTLTQTRQGIYLKLGKPGMDVTTASKQDLDFLQKRETKIPGPTGSQKPTEEIMLTHPFLIANP